MPVVQRVARAARQSSKTHQEEPRAAAAKKQAPAVGALKIRVVTMASGAEQPVQAAKVTVGGKSQTTQASGEVTFTGVPAGKRLVTVRHECFPEWRQNQTVARGATAEIRAELVRVSLKEAAERRGTQVGARQGERAPREFHAAVYGTFWNSRSPDHDPNPDPAQRIDNRPVVETGNLDLIQYRFSDDVYKSLQATSQTPGMEEVKGFRLQGTPLVWPAPNNSPGTPGASTVWENRGWPGEYLNRHARKNGTIDKKLVRDKIDEIHGRFIRACMEHDAQVYGGKTREWIVVNEILNLKFSSTARKHGFWGKHYGIWEKDKKQIYAHVLEAFKVAHATDPDAVLILNDFNVEGVDPEQERPAGAHPDKPGSPRKIGSAYYYYWKPRMLRALAVWLRKKLRSKKVMGRSVADKFAVGFQMHVPTERRKKKYLAQMVYENVKWFRKRGIKVYVTEIDVIGPEKKQYKVYRNLFAALHLGGCRSITTWGVFDYEESGKLHRCMFHETEGCKEVGPPYRRRSYYGAVSGLLHARQLRAEILKDKQ